MWGAPQARGSEELLNKFVFSSAGALLTSARESEPLVVSCQAIAACEKGHQWPLP